MAVVIVRYYYSVRRDVPSPEAEAWGFATRRGYGQDETARQRARLVRG